MVHYPGQRAARPHRQPWRDLPKKDRERDGETEYEEWIYGTPPQDVDFVRFVGDEVVRVETMTVAGQKVVRTEKEVDLPTATVAKKPEERPRQQGPRPPLDITGPRLPRLVQSVVASRCYNCATALLPDTDFRGSCPKCNAALHCCKQCAHFEPSTRFQCLKPDPAHSHRTVREWFTRLNRATSEPRSDTAEARQTSSTSSNLVMMR